MMKILLISFSILVLIVDEGYSQANCSTIDLQEDLIAHFPLDGNAVEAMGSGFDGAVNGAFLTSDRKQGPQTAYVFDGTNDFIHVGDHFDLGTSDFSISVWVNVIKFTGLIPGTNSSGGPVINKGLTIFGTPSRAGYGFSAREFQDQHHFDFYVGGQNGTIYRVGGFGYEENRWYSLIGIKEADSMRFYVDNQRIGAVSIPANTNVDTNIPLVFGSIDKLGNDPRGTNYLNGKIDDVRIYTRALSFAERECLIDSCSPPRVDLGDDRITCDNSLVLEATSAGSTYEWQDGSTQPTFEATRSGTYFVEVTNACGVSRDEVQLEFNTVPNISLGTVITACEGSRVFLDASYPGSTSEWQDGSTSPVLEVRQAGIYSVEVENTCGSGSDTVQVVFNTPPDIDLGTVINVCDGNPVFLDASHPGSTYTWHNGSTLPTFEATQSGAYAVEVENICGVGRDSVEVIFQDFTDMMIPNVFTPNKDGLNDRFEVDEKLMGSKVSIFGRWGQMIYENDSYQNDWAGGNLSSGVYYYLITDVCGGTYKGWISILY